MVHLFAKVLLLIVLFFNLLVHAQSKPKELLPPEVIESDKASVNEVVESMYVSSDVLSVPKELEGKLFAEPDLSLVEIQAIEDVIKSRSKKREIIYIRYTNGDLRVVEALIKAKKKGVKVTVITDFNTVMKGNFKDGEKYNTRYEEAEYQKNEKGELSEGARAVQTLTENGFTIGKDLLSQPLYLETETSRVPIMHIKGMITFVGERITTWMGTNNASRNQRYNRLLKIVDQSFGLEFLEYLRALTKVFKAEKPIGSTDARPPLQINYKDGSFLKISFTQGRYNTNDAQIELLRTAQLNTFYLSHFAPAYNKLVDALYKNLQTVSLQATGTYVVDDRFGSQDSWGALIRLSGFNILMPFGKMYYGVKDSVARRVKGYIYQRFSFDPDTGERRFERNQDGPPEERHVWHDKSTLYELANKTVHIFTGSFNLSGNFRNAEIQAEIKSNTDSWLTKAMIHSIEDVIEKEKGQWMMSDYEAAVRNSVGILTGHTDLEVPIELARELMEAFKSKNVEAVEAALTKMKIIDSFLDARIDKTVIEARIAAFINYYRWYLANVGGEQNFSDARLRRLTLIPFLLGKSDLTNGSKYNIMEAVVWKPEISGNQEATDKLVLEGLAAIGITDVTAPVAKPAKVINLLPEQKESTRTSRPRRSAPACARYFAA